MIINESKNTICKENVKIDGDIKIGHFSILGANNPNPLIIGKNASVGGFCIIEGNSIIGENAVIDDYCAIYSNVQIGNNLKLLYGKNIYGRSVIGDDCIIGGNVPERMIISDRVTFMGEVAHSHYNPKKDWDTTDEPSPTIGEGSIIGVNALIIGGIKIGKNCYVSAGEILNHNLEDNSVYLKGKVYEISYFKNLIQTRY